jgi:hypothetical protein
MRARKLLILTLMYTALALFMMPAMVMAELIGISWSSINNAVSSIDESTGSISLIGYVGYGRLNALAQDRAGNFYSCSESKLINIDPITGSGSVVATLDGISSVRGLAFSDQGVLYATNNTPPYGPDDTLYGALYGLYTINPLNGTVSTVGTWGYSNDVRGLEYIPEPATPSLLVLGGVVMIPRKHRGMNRHRRRPPM